jgi:hypothetical protein
MKYIGASRRFAREFPKAAPDIRGAMMTVLAIPPWDEDVARALVGKYVLIGLTFENEKGDLLRQVQLHGRIVRADRREGIKVMLAGIRSGQEYLLPPQTNAFERAAVGRYTLRSTGEVVVNPDFVSSWVMTE